MSTPVAHGVTAETLLGMAGDVLRDQTGAWEGAWARAVALLTRQALETALDELWNLRGVALGHVSTHAQMLCLRSYLKDDSLAADVRYAWAALSRACHHHPYELAPTTHELDRWIATTAALVSRIQEAPDAVDRPQS